MLHQSNFSVGMRLVLLLPEEPGVSRWMKRGIFCGSLHVPQQAEQRAAGWGHNHAVLLPANAVEHGRKCLTQLNAMEKYSLVARI